MFKLKVLATAVLFIFSVVVAVRPCVFLCANEQIKTGDILKSPEEANNFRFSSFLTWHCLVDLFDQKKTTVVRVIGINNIPDNDKQSGNDQDTSILPQTVLSGSGFFVSDNAYIITAASIVASAHVLWVEYLGLSYAAECIGYDPALNIAVIRLLQPPEKLEIIDITSSDIHTLSKIGDFIALIGCKLDLDPAPSLGNVVGKNIAYGDHVFLTTYLRADIEFCGGESGAPVFDLDGNLVGMMIAALPELHSSFVLPKRAIQRAYDDIIQFGHVSYGAIGIEIHAEYKLGIGQQIIVSRVLHDSNAEKCGLRAGDILISMDDWSIKHREDLHNALFFSHPGKDMKIIVIRNGQKIELTMQVEQSIPKQ